MRQILFFIFYAPLLLQAQQEQRVHFEKDLTWEQLLSKASSEYKFIFVSLVSPQCQDCKSLSDEVYASKDVAKFMNDEFVSVEIYFDTSITNRTTKNASPVNEPAFQKKYNIINTPTYLFFSSDGQLVHKGKGRSTAREFLLLASQSLDPADQYYTVIRAYTAGKKDYPILGPIIRTALALGDQELANTMATDYKVNYLNHLPDTQLCSVQHFEFYSQFIQQETTAGRLFKLCSAKPDLVDRETEKGYAEKTVLYFINREEVEEKLWKKNIAVNTPDWGIIYKSISDKYSVKYAKILVPPAKIDFYKRTQNWVAFAKEVDEYYRLHPPQPGDGLDSDSWKLNVHAWDVFLHCDDKVILQRALEWSDRSLKLNPVSVQYIDTKANLLYKLGKRAKGIEWEQIAINNAIQQAELYGVTGNGFLNSYIAILNKMKAGQPTWDVNN